MIYIKPEIKIQKFDIIDDIADEGSSASVTLPTNPDAGDEDGNIPGYEHTNAFNLGQ